MRFLYTIFFLLITLSIAAQKASTLKEVLKTTAEISIKDSILINYLSLKKTALDKPTAESFFKLIYPNEKQADQKAKYFVAGKITSHNDFDILLLCTEKIVKDLSEVGSSYQSFNYRELHFVLLDKEGNYKNDFLGAMNYETVNFLQKDRRTKRKISSWIYKDFKIIQQIEAEIRTANLTISPSVKEETKTLNFSMEYHINDYGVFVAYPKYNSD